MVSQIGNVLKCLEKDNGVRYPIGISYKRNLFPEEIGLDRSIL